LHRAQCFINRNAETSFPSTGAQHKQLEMNPVAESGFQQGLGRAMDDCSDQQEGVDDTCNVFTFCGVIR